MKKAAEYGAAQTANTGNPTKMKNCSMFLKKFTILMLSIIKVTYFRLVLKGGGGGNGDLKGVRT
jgi:hypothetical protein